MTKKPYLVYIGNAHPHKNVENLIKAAEILKIKLVLVGDDNFFYGRLPRSKYVKFAGQVSNKSLIAYYRGAAAFVSASQMEGFGLPGLEAMTAGCPVIVSDIPVFHEIYGDAAVYFNQKDPNNMAEVIAKTLKNKSLAVEIVKRGYNQSAKYSWKKFVKQTRDVYKSVLE